MRKVKDVMAYAIKKCQEIDYVGCRYVRVYAVVTTKRNRIISEASNDYKSSCKVQRKYAKIIDDNKMLSHAECQALSNIHPQYLNDVYKIYVARVYADGSVANACPCKICQRAIKAFGIKVIEHTI